MLVELRPLALISGQNYQKLNSAIRHEFNHYSNTCIFLVFNLRGFVSLMCIIIMSRQGCKHRLREFPITIRDYVIWHVLTQTRYAYCLFCDSLLATRIFTTLKQRYWATLTNGHSYYCLCKKGNFNVGYVECLLSSICFRCFLIWDRLHHLHVQFLALNHRYALQIVTGIQEHWMFYTKSYVRLVNIHIWVYGKICFITEVSKYFRCLAAGPLQCHYTFWNDRSK